jgi:hypothetical protein
MFTYLTLITKTMTDLLQGVAGFNETSNAVVTAIKVGSR